MAIHRMGSDLVRPVARAEVSGADGTKEDESANTLGSKGDRKDRVELSKQGLARAAELSVEAESGTAAQRGAEVRMRIATAFYDEPSVALEVARRLNDSGDLHDPSTTT